MGRWTAPRELAFADWWYDEFLDYDGPACYELGTSARGLRDIAWHYVGETGNERQRMQAYARDGSHLDRDIARELARGRRLYYRARACATKWEAKQMQDNLLDTFIYDWNRQRN